MLSSADRLLSCLGHCLADTMMAAKKVPLMDPMMGMKKSFEMVSWTAARMDHLKAIEMVHPMAAQIFSAMVVQKALC